MSPDRLDTVEVVALTLLTDSYINVLYFFARTILCVNLRCKYEKYLMKEKCMEDYGDSITVKVKEIWGSERKKRNKLILDHMKDV